MNKPKELTREIECGPSDTPYTFVYEYEPLVRGRISGPPEDCYPDEGGFATIYEVRTQDGKVVDEAEFEALGIDIPTLEERIYVELSESEEDCDDRDDE